MTLSIEEYLSSRRRLRMYLREQRTLEQWEQSNLNRAKMRIRLRIDLANYLQQQENSTGDP